MPLKTVSPMANVDQQQAELLALEIINSSAVSMARTRARTLMERHPIALTLDGATQLDYSLDKWVSQLALQDVGRDLSTPRIIWSTTVAPYAWMGHAFPGSAAAIDCPDNIYRNGKYNISDTHKKQLVELFEAIKPYQEHINLVFIGHTDQTPIKSKFGVIESNLILSHLRAAKAVEFAIEKGFDPMWVSSQGLSEYTRNTRSLSVRIMER